MEENKLTEQELYSYKHRIVIAISNLSKREKLPVYCIQTCEDSTLCYKIKDEAIKHVNEMSETDHELFCEDDPPVILKTIYLDNVEYEQNSDSWICI